MQRTTQEHRDQVHAHAQAKAQTAVRATEPRVLKTDVDMDLGRPGRERQMHQVARIITRGTVVHAAPGSAYEQLLGGISNLGELTGQHRAGVSN